MEEGDRMSFDDSDRFEEDSLCSWGSEPESLCNNWRGWKKPLITSTALNSPLLASNQRRAEGEFQNLSSHLYWLTWVGQAS